MPTDNDLSVDCGVSANKVYALFFNICQLAYLELVLRWANSKITHADVSKLMVSQDPSIHRLIWTLDDVVFVKFPVNLLALLT